MPSNISRLSSRACVLFVLATVDVTFGTTIYVDADSPSMSPDGMSWATAFQDLQAALGMATDGDQIWVANGTYLPDGGFIPAGGILVPGSGNQELSFQLVSRVAIYGGFEGNDSLSFPGGETDIGQRTPDLDPSNTNPSFDSVLSGDLDFNGSLDSQNSFNVLRIEDSMIDPDANCVILIDGFSIVLGHAVGPSQSENNVGGGIFIARGCPTIRDCQFINNYSLSTGGAVWAAGSTPSIDNCGFFGNTNPAGGAAINLQEQSGGVIQDCVFEGNITTAVNENLEGGGAIRNFISTSPQIIRCTFKDNRADSVFGGAIFNETDCNPVISDCMFVNNSARRGGAVANIGNPFGFPGGIRPSNPTITGCDFEGNFAASRGGGIYCDESTSVTITGSEFRANSSSDIGGALAAFNTAINLNACGFMRNDAISDAGGLRLDSSSSVTLTDCILVKSEKNAIDVRDCTIVELLRCRLIDNDAQMLIRGGASVVARQCIFAGNTESTFIETSNTELTATNCAFVGNSVTAGNMDGGAIECRGGGRVNLWNCTVADNSAVNRGGGVFVDDDTGAAFLSAGNSIFWGNVAGNGTNTSESAQIFVRPASVPNVNVDFSDLQGGWTGLGGNNIATDPLFVGGTTLSNSTAAPVIDLSTSQTTILDAGASYGVDELVGLFINPNTGQRRQSLIVRNTATTITFWGDFLTEASAGSQYQINDYRLREVSPCVDRGNNTLVPMELEFDLAGFPRIQTLTVDQGAYEFNFDCNGDQILDVDQLAKNDCDSNGVPDDCQPDCNNNGIADECDVDPADPDGNGMTSSDCDNDLVPDECELSGNDCNGNLIPDNCDAAALPIGFQLLVSSNTGASVVKRYALPDGQYADDFAFGVNEAFGMAQRSNGDIYVALTNDSIVRIDAMTRVVTELVPPNNGDIELAFSMVFGPDDKLYVTSRGDGIGTNGNTVLRYDPDTGAPLPSPTGNQGTAEFVAPGAGGLTAPDGLAFGPFGRLYVSSNEAGPDMDRIIRFDESTGASLGSFTSTGPGVGAPSEPFSITFGPDGDLYVTSFQSQEIKKYAGPLSAAGGGGQFLFDFITVGADLTQPQALTFGPDGHLYVADGSDGMGGSGTIHRFDGTTGNNLPGPGQPGSILFPSGSGGLGFPTSLLIVVDCNANGIPDACDIDCNADGIPDDCQSFGDCNGDDIPDACQLIDNDCDGNGLPDDCQPDCNSNGTPDECDVDPMDPDGDGLTSLDCNNDTVPDECQLSGNDCNGDMIPDDCQLADNDCNSNTIPDDCELPVGCGDTLSIWTGAGGDSNWSNAANWCPQIVPNNGNMGRDFAVRIGSGAVVALDDGLPGTVTICALDVDPTATLDANSNNGRTLIVLLSDGLNCGGAISIQNNSNRMEADGQIMNDGTISIIAAQGTADFVPSAMGTELASPSGQGEVRLFNAGTSRIGSTSTSVSFTNSFGHLICGAGDVVGEFTNNGVVMADAPNNELTLRGTGTARTNNHRIVATNGGVLQIGGVMNQGVAGVIEASDGDVLLGSSAIEIATVEGGTLKQTSGQLITGNLSRIIDVTIEGTLTVPSITERGFVEGTINNSGVIELNPGNSGVSTLATRDVGSGGAVSFQGDGRLLLLNENRAIFESRLPTFPIATNGADHTIEGVGIISARLVNDGTIRTNVQLENAEGTQLSINPSDGLELKVNNGTMSASDFATLAINTDLTNDGQLISSSDGTLAINAPVSGSGNYLADAGIIAIGADITEIPQASGFSMISEGGTINIATGNTVDGCGPIIVFPKSGSSNSTALVELDNSNLINSSSWEIGDNQVGVGLTGTIRLLNDSTGVVNGPVMVRQNGTLEVSNSSFTAIDLNLEDGASLLVGSSITLSGSLSHDLTLNGATQWDWMQDSRLVLTGGQMPLSNPCSLEGWATIEAASADVGPGSSDFEFEILEVTSGSHVSIVDLAENHAPSVPEAIYCEDLNLGLGSVLNLNGRNLYVEGTPVLVGSFGMGSIVDMPRVITLGDFNSDSMIDVDDIDGFVAVLLGVAIGPVEECIGDLNGDGVANGLDISIFNELLTTG